VTWWKISALSNLAVMAAYLAISFAIAHGLRRSRQWRKNSLGLATAAIFFTCALGHGSHAGHLLLPSVGLERIAGGELRAASDNFHSAVWDIATAVVGAWYWTLRSRFPALVRGAAIFEDLRLRQAAEQTLRASEERYRGIVETTSEGVVLADREGRIEYANAQFWAMVGETGQPLPEPTLVDLVSPEDREQLRRTLHQVRHGGTQRADVNLRHAEGRTVCAQVALSARLDAAGAPNGTLAMVADVTEQKDIEAQLRQAQKLDAVGQLAGGVAHDFNNLLTVIDGYAAMLLANGDGPGQELTAIRESAARASALTRQLLAFSRTQTARPTSVDINDLVLGVEDMLRRLIREDIDLTVATSTGPATVWADRGQLEQVLVNLAVNSRDAMPTGGALSIRVDQVDLDPEQAAPLGGEAGWYVLLTVADTGCGISADIRTRIFEPFFTTKEHGKGAGLGLSTVYGIVRQAKGYIQVDSEPAAGSTFRLYLPRYLPAVAPAGPLPHGDREPDRLAEGSGTILLAEDDPAVRELTARILRTAGYRVLVAASGHQALSLARKHPGIDLLLTDVVMPGINGQQLADQLTALVPGLPVVFASAHTRGVLADRGNTPTFTYLDKPFTAATLTETVRDSLDGCGRR
jgi:two-component system, cell cycle sensor histidine kinase and response regulator CckA